MGNPEPIVQYTPEEYLKLEHAAAYKNEYYNGMILPMESHTFNQNMVSMDCYFAINAALNRAEWTPVGSIVKIRIDEPMTYFYPEMAVVKGKPQLKDNKYSYTNPTLIVEVLAEWSEAFDRGKKFHRYKLIPTFQEYVLVSKDEYQAEVFYKLNEADWQYTSYEGLEAVMELRSLGIQVKLSEIYQRVEFEL